MSLVFRAESARNRQPDPIHSSLLLLLLILFFSPLLFTSLCPSLQSPLLFPAHYPFTSSFPHPPSPFSPSLLFLFFSFFFFFCRLSGFSPSLFPDPREEWFCEVPPVSSQTSRQTILPSTICPSVHPFLRAFCHTHTSVRGERSLPASSTLWKQSSEGSRPAPRSESTPPASFYLQPPGPSFGFQLHGKTFGAAANVPPLHLLLPPLSPDQGRLVRRVDLFYPLQLKGCLFATKKKKKTRQFFIL